MKLANKTILITGANRGIGRALAEELAKQPTHLLLGMRDTKDHRPLINNNALSVKPIKLELGSQKAIDASVKAAKADLQKVDVLVNNAGLYVGGSLSAKDTSQIYSMVQVNLTGLIHLTACLLPQMLKKPEAKIVNNASIAGYAFLPGNAAYSATKAGVVAFSESLRRELRGTNVGVLHLVTPGVKTKMIQEVEQNYRKSGQPIRLGTITPEAWAKRVVKAIMTDKSVLPPGGTTGILRILSRGPHGLVDIIAARMFKKTPFQN